MRFTPTARVQATSVDGALAMGPDACCDQVRVPYQNARPRTGRQDRSDTGVGDKLRGAGLRRGRGLAPCHGRPTVPLGPDRPAASPLNPFLSDVPSVQLQVYVPRHSPDVATPPPRSAARRPSCVVRRVFDRRSRSGRLSYSYSFFALASTATSATSRALSPMKQRAPVHVGRPW